MRDLQEGILVDGGLGRLALGRDAVRQGGQSRDRVQGGALQRLHPGHGVQLGLDLHLFVILPGLEPGEAEQDQSYEDETGDRILVHTTPPLPSPPPA